MVQPASTLDVMARSGSIGSLVSQTVADAKRLLNAQAALASSELMQTGAAAATTGAIALLAVGTALLFIVFALITVAYVLVAVGLPVWAGFAIVTGVLLVLTAVLALVAKASSAKITGPKLSVEQWRKTAQMLSEQPDTHA